MEKVIITEVATDIHGNRVVQDEEEARDALLEGETIARFEYGHSMSPMLVSGEYCTVTPCDINDVKQGDAVFCEVNGYLMTHMVLLVSEASEGQRHFLISSSQLNVYGWTDKIYGIAKGTNIVQAPPSYEDDLAIIENI